MKEYRALTIIHGALTICTYTPGQGRCPECRKKEFSLDGSWIRCDNCGFAIDKNDYDRMMRQMEIDEDNLLRCTD